MRFFDRQLGRGFTLIEVLVSLAIFALAAVVLSAAYLNIIGGYRSMGARHQAEEDWKWVRSMVQAEPDREKIEQGGQIPLPDGRQVTWSAKIDPTEVADLFRLTLEAGTSGAGEPAAWQRSASSHLLRPAWSDPVERDRLREQTRQRVEQERR